ncbi:hypothetical protein EUGRSUZ_F03877 [Eucalyptus grandis]|uniref:AtPDCT1/2 transmembrane domain-containing protein n=2 Tax=Eucalyptus grandis TaxID=71139 RepID=A0A059BX64_EUCGR|nr:hypothetical protein EUGRSUZ_F03877 [Eucalyptus grandis]
MAKKSPDDRAGWLGGAIYGPASFVNWTRRDVAHVARHHWIPCVFAACLLFFMGVEYTLRMVPASSPPFDIGFVATQALHRLLSSSPELNTLLAALNTVFVGMQTTYILWTWVIERRPRATIATLFMFTCRGILGYSTQLPLPQLTDRVCSFGLIDGFLWYIVVMNYVDVMKLDGLTKTTMKLNIKGVP